MPSAWPRAAFGFFAAAVSDLTLHQGMWAILHAAGEMPLPYPMHPVGRFGSPFTIDLCFWVGVWGALFGLVLPAFPPRLPLWLPGLGLGILAALVGLFIVTPLKGGAWGSGFPAMDYVRSFLINGFWGIGVGLILPLMLPAVRQTE